MKGRYTMAQGINLCKAMYPKKALKGLHTIGAGVGT